jgi:hypothetical protein
METIWPKKKGLKIAKIVVNLPRINLIYLLNFIFFKFHISLAST